MSIDFKNAEATFEYDPAKAFPGTKPEQVIQQLDNLLKSASNHTFGIKPLRSVPLEKLQLIEIPVAGLDCKACCLAAYEAIYKLEGVERATASFREGRVTALIDPEKTDRAKLEAALKKRGVQLKSALIATIPSVQTNLRCRLMVGGAEGQLPRATHRTEGGLPGRAPQFLGLPLGLRPMPTR